jgi:hypothetical protein
MSADILQQDIQTLLEFFSKNTYRAGVDTQIVSFFPYSCRMSRFTSPEHVLIIKQYLLLTSNDFHHFPSLKSGRIYQFRSAFYLPSTH